MKLIVLFFIYIFKCILSEEINSNIKETQNLTNIIKIGEENSRFINFANFSNGTMVLEVSSEPGNSKRYFFGLNPDGSYLFEEDGAHQICLTASGQSGNSYNQRNYAENFCVTINDEENKEYIVSIANKEQYTELYDFETRHIYQKVSTDIMGYSIDGFRHSSANFVINSKHYIVFLSWIDYTAEKYKSFRMKILNFKNKNLNFDEISVIDYPVDTNYSNMTSCFVSKSNYIWNIGFIQEEQSDHSTPAVYYIFVYSPFNLNETIYSDNFPVKPFWGGTFFKMVHLRDDIGVLVFYSYPYVAEVAYPSFLVKEIKDNQLKNYIELNNGNPIVIHFSKLFNFRCLINDLIRLSDYKVSLVTTDLNSNGKLYIVILEIYSPTEYFIKLYEMDVFYSYHIKFYQEIREHLFQNHLALGFNFCNTEQCDEKTKDTHYSAFLIFSYPNSTNEYLNINQYLDANEGVSIDNITINLTKYVYIENNIFGYVPFSIEIVDLCGCDGLIFKSSWPDNKIIIKNSEIEGDEDIKISFENKVKSFNCSIYFRYVITEPDYSSEQAYYIESIISDDNFTIEQVHDNNKTLYPGKISFYNIIFEYDEPTTVILPEYQSTLVTYKETEQQIEYTTETINTVKTDKMTEIVEKTSLNTYQSERITQLPTENQTEPKSEVITEPTTEIIAIPTTIKLTERNIERSTERIEIQTEFEEKIITDKKIETEKIVETTEIQKIEIQEDKDDKEEKVCSNDEVLNNECEYGIVEIKQIKELFNQFSDNIISFNYQGGDMKIIQTQNIIFQIIIINAQDIGLNPNVSVVNIGECEKILKSKYGISDSDSLIMVKSDTKNKDLSSTSVVFNLYHPITKEKLNMSYCDDVDIKIDIPTQLENNTIDLYDSLIESGYNLFDSSDSFYNDVCSVYTSTNGTDMTLSDRQNIIYNQAGKISLCQAGCTFNLYNKTYKTVQCDCNIKSTSIESNSDIIDEKEFKNSFIKTILNSNFAILKCIKSAFSLKNIFTNKGRITMTIFIFFYIIIIIWNT